MVKNPPAMLETKVQSLDWEDPLKWQPTPVFLPGESTWSQEPGGPQSTGSQRVRHDEVTNTFTFLLAHFCSFILYWRIASGSVSKGSACNSGDLSLIPELGRSPGGDHGNPLQHSCLEDPSDQRSLAEEPSPCCCKELDMTEAT